MFASLPKSFSIKKSAVLLAISEEVVTKAREMLQHALQRESGHHQIWMAGRGPFNGLLLVAFGLVNGVALFTTKIKGIILCK